MTRRIVRAGLQLAIFSVVVFILVVFLDNRYRVLPQAIHNHLPAHHPGFVVTDVTVITCSSINPFSSCTKDGPNWHRINEDLYLGSGYVSKAYLHVRRKKEDTLESHEEIVLDVKVGRTTPQDTTDNPLSKDERWESRPAGIWVKLSSKRHMGDAAKLITGVDVLFGPDAATRGPALATLAKPTPRIRKDGKFKIMQAADLHLATGLGKCRDAEPPLSTPCEADTRTLQFIESLLLSEQPDLIILSGDQVNGDTSLDAQTAIFKYASLFASHKIPYAGIFGNHDDEGSLSRAESMAIMDGLPYSLSTSGPSDIDGVGNYVLEILGRGSTTHSALTLYLLDTHSYSPDERHHRGYDWLKPSQIEWFRSTSQSLKRKHKEYTHIHMNLAFIHIPLPEYRNPHSFNIVGNWTEPPTAPGVNSGFMDALIEENVLFVSCGHDHVNDYCVPGADKETKEPKLWMCYGGGSGFGGYGGYGGYIRRVRFFEFDMNAARVTTWKRLEAGDTEKRWDLQTIVDGGKGVF
ncbi:Phosphatase DCR2 [Cyphellophora attinorum]|uniref:Phosphatase DCR2 n=1 Tax=Cyphellophora attinorum TaxID=1664694 RepID=A0A0N0NIU4_9EURO|nr:Phosphatase DCR2 [Phialophora attinorum]KPI36231.1 Phosphatase DCR2 [Phialophora attinorum]